MNRPPPDSGIGLVSVRKVGLPRAAERSQAIRILVEVEELFMHVDRVMLEASRATVMLVASSALVPFRRRDVLAFARVRTGRMPTAMRGS